VRRTPGQISSTAVTNKMAPKRQSSGRNVGLYVLLPILGENFIRQRPLR
jgi:hypothetical protein